MGIARMDYVSPYGEGVEMSTGPKDFFYGIAAEDVNKDVLNKWAETANPTYLTPGNREGLTSSLYRYSGIERPGRYMSSQRSADKSMLEEAGLLVNGQLGARSLERMPSSVDLRYGGGKYGGLRPENIRALFQRKQQRIYSDLLEQRKAEQAEQATTKTPTTAQTTVGEPRSTGYDPYRIAGLYRKEGRSPALGNLTLRDRRRATARHGGPEALRRSRMAANLAGYRAVSPERRGGYGRYSPYSETWWDWGQGIGGTDKGGNVWSIADLGIQY